MSQPILPSPILVACGRWLLALYFLGPALSKIFAFDSNLSMMLDHKVPMPEILLVIATIAQTAGSLSLLLDRFVRFSALGLVAYIIVINVMMHDFWNLSGLVFAHELQNFIKNLGILAGLLILAGITPWRKVHVFNIFLSDTAALKAEAQRDA